MSETCAEAWWSFEQVADYVRTHRPCRSLFEAGSLVEARIADGTLPTRYRRPDQHCLPIGAAEWRWTRDGGVFEWRGLQAQERLGQGGGKIEIEAAAAQRLYRPQTASSDDRLRAEGAASFRLSCVGDVDSQAGLERELQVWCSRTGISLSEPAIRDIAGAAIKTHRARKQVPL